MLSINDYNHLKLLYERFLRMNAHIKEMVLKGEWQNVDFAVQEKEILLKQILLFEKPRIKHIKTNKELNSMRIKLIELEKQNISLIKRLRVELIKELSGVKKTKKVLNAYEPSINSTISTFEIDHED